MEKGTWNERDVGGTAPYDAARNRRGGSPSSLLEGGEGAISFISQRVIVLGGRDFRSSVRPFVRLFVRSFVRLFVSREGEEKSRATARLPGLSNGGCVPRTGSPTDRKNSGGNRACGRVASIVLVFRMDCFETPCARARRANGNIKLHLARFDTRQSPDDPRSRPPARPPPLPALPRLINLLMSSAVPLPSRVSSISCAAFPRYGTRRRYRNRYGQFSFFGILRMISSACPELFLHARCSSSSSNSGGDSAETAS